MSSPNEQEATAPQMEGLEEKWSDLLVWLGFSALELRVLVHNNLTFEGWRDWSIVAGAFFFPLAALGLAYSLANDPRVAGIGKIIAVVCQ